MLRFVHIGKTGGSTIHEILKQKNIKFKEYHLKKSYKPNEKYIIWLRNPLSRFVSAFNYISHLVNYDCNNKKPSDINNNNCLFYPFIRRKIINKSPFVFNKRYDNLVKKFKNANSLAEGLTSSNLEIKIKALKLMNYEFENIHKGIGWYLNNGIFVNNPNRKIIFVGKQETMKEDIEKLSDILNVKLNTEHVVRKNTFSSNQSKYLSPLAIANLIEFFKDTDYAALIELNKHGWISDDVLASYYMYP
jgi:hypothetical protein